jgi:hypothetical protein
MDSTPILAHLASEFYIWLWWMSENHDGEISFSDEGDHVSIDLPGGCEFWIESRLAFREVEDLKPIAVFTGDNPSVTPEARAALRGGKAVQEVRLGIRFEDREYSSTLYGPAVMLKNTKLPQVISEGDEGVLFDRMYLIEELDKILGLLFQQFAQQRTSTKWAEEILPQVQRWAGENT